MKKVSTLLFTFFISCLVVGSAFAGTFVPEKEFADKYGNKVVVQDADVSHLELGMPPDLDAWVLFDKESIHPTRVLVSYLKGTGEERQHKVWIKNTTGYYYSSVSSGNWTIKIFSLTPEGGKGKELASFPYSVRSDRSILVRIYLQ